MQKGRKTFYERMGQLNLSCAQCHEERAGLKLGGAVIPQGHPNAYPIYRLEWQTLGSLQRRLRNCMSGVRAQQFDYGSPEMGATRVVSCGACTRTSLEVTRGKALIKLISQRMRLR